MKIQISELRKFSTKLFDHLEESGNSIVELNTDYYWVISKSQLYDPNNDPDDFSLGQLSDDYEFLEKMASGESPPIAYGLLWLSSLARYIAEKVVS